MSAPGWRLSHMLKEGESYLALPKVENKSLLFIAIAIAIAIRFILYGLEGDRHSIPSWAHRKQLCET